MLKVLIFIQRVDYKVCHSPSSLIILACDFVGKGYLVSASGTWFSTEVKINVDWFGALS